MQPWWAEETFKSNLTDPKRLNYIAAELYSNIAAYFYFI